jgi:hypothetical protein
VPFSHTHIHIPTPSHGRSANRSTRLTQVNEIDGKASHARPARRFNKIDWRETRFLSFAARHRSTKLYHPVTKGSRKNE